MNSKQLIEALSEARQECIAMSEDGRTLSGGGNSLLRSINITRNLLDIAYRYASVLKDGSLDKPLTEKQARPGAIEMHETCSDYVTELIGQAESACTAGALAADLLDRHGPITSALNTESINTIVGSLWSAQELIEIAIHVIETANGEVHAIKPVDSELTEASNESVNKTDLLDARDDIQKKLEQSRCVVESVRMAAEGNEFQGVHSLQAVYEMLTDTIQLYGVVDRSITAK